MPPAAMQIKIYTVPGAVGMDLGSMLSAVGKARMEARTNVLVFPEGALFRKMPMRKIEQYAKEIAKRKPRELIVAYCTFTMEEKIGEMRLRTMLNVIDGHWHAEPKRFMSDMEAWLSGIGDGQDERLKEARNERDEHWISTHPQNIHYAIKGVEFRVCGDLYNSTALRESVVAVSSYCISPESALKAACGGHVVVASDSKERRSGMFFREMEKGQAVFWKAGPQPVYGGGVGMEQIQP